MSTFRASTDELLDNNRSFANGFSDEDLATPPTRQLAVVTCMDSRLDVLAILGLNNGEAHIIRNAGGVVTDDVIRSLYLSQRYMNTKEILLLHHTDCGMQSMSEDVFRAEIEDEIGIKPRWAVESFSDPFEDVRQSARRLRLSPFIVEEAHIRALVYDVATGKIKEVTDRPV